MPEVWPVRVALGVPAVGAECLIGGDAATAKYHGNQTNDDNGLHFAHEHGSRYSFHQGGNGRRDWTGRNQFR